MSVENIACMAVGPWQLIVLCAALDEDGMDTSRCDLILYEPHGSTAQFRELMYRMADLAGPWRSVRDVYALTTASILGGRSRASKAEVLWWIQNTVQLRDVGEIWLTKTTSFFEKIIGFAFPAARIVEYEEGLHSYLPPRSDRRDLRCKVRSVFHRERNFIATMHGSEGIVARSIESRCRSVYLALADTLPVPSRYNRKKIRQINFADLRGRCDAFTGLAASVNDEIVRPAPGAVLILPQCLHRYGEVSREDEFSIYREIVREFVGRGRRVVWKDHPRANPPYWLELSEEFNDSVVKMTGGHGIPIEVLVGQLKCSVCIGGPTTALLYLNKIYGLKCYTFTNHIQHLLTGDALKMARLLMDAVPPIET